MAEFPEPADRKSAIEILKESWRGNRYDPDASKSNACLVLIQEAQNILEQCARDNSKIEQHEFRLINGLNNLKGLKSSIDIIADEGLYSDIWNSVLESAIDQKDFRKMIARIASSSKPGERKKETFQAFGLDSDQRLHYGRGVKRKIWVMAEKILKENGPMTTDEIVTEIKRLRPINAATVTTSLHRKRKIFARDYTNSKWCLIGE